MDCRLPRVHVAHGDLNVIVSGELLQRKGVCLLSSLGSKGMTPIVDEIETGREEALLVLLSVVKQFVCDGLWPRRRDNAAHDEDYLESTATSTP